jgi:hypothetical protein
MIIVDLRSLEFQLLDRAVGRLQVISLPLVNRLK